MREHIIPYMILGLLNDWHEHRSFITFYSNEISPYFTFIIIESIRRDHRKIKSKKEMEITSFMMMELMMRRWTMTTSRNGIRFIRCEQMQ
jgi:hypothetical protein